MYFQSVNLLGVLTVNNNTYVFFARLFVCHDCTFEVTIVGHLKATYCDGEIRNIEWYVRACSTFHTDRSQSLLGVEASGWAQPGHCKVPCSAGICGFIYRTQHSQGSVLLRYQLSCNWEHNVSILCIENKLWNTSHNTEMQWDPQCAAEQSASYN